VNKRPCKIKAIGGFVMGTCRGVPPTPVNKRPCKIKAIGGFVMGTCSYLIGEKAMP